MLSVAARATLLTRRASSPLSLSTRRTIIRIFWSGSLSFIVGFVIWNLDNTYCETLKVWKAALGWPAAFVLEGRWPYVHGLFRAILIIVDALGHAWWHFLTVSLS